MFFRRGGLLYRRWTPAKRRVEREIEQLILPEKCRRTVLKLAHRIPIAGHLGSEKTRQRLLRRFYWPGIFKDVEEFCRSCPTCQKTSQHRVSKAPSIPLPIISEPFSRIAMDIVGPLPRRKSGNHHMRLCHTIPGSNSSSKHRCRTHCGGIDQSVCTSGSTSGNSYRPG